LTLPNRGVGKIERTEKTFELTQTAPTFSPQGILEGKFFGLFIHGQIFDEGPAQSKIEIDFCWPGIHYSDWQWCIYALFCLPSDF
jgi:hypothetical protein